MYTNKIQFQNRSQQTINEKILPKILQSLQKAGYINVRVKIVNKEASSKYHFGYLSFFESIYVSRFYLENATIREAHNDMKDILHLIDEDYLAKHLKKLTRK